VFVKTVWQAVDPDVKTDATATNAAHRIYRARLAP
jgi:hypothetical protein